MNSPGGKLFASGQIVVTLDAVHGADLSGVGGVVEKPPDEQVPAEVLVVLGGPQNIVDSTRDLFLLSFAKVVAGGAQEGALVVRDEGVEGGMKHPKEELSIDASGDQIASLKNEDSLTLGLALGDLPWREVRPNPLNVPQDLLTAFAHLAKPLA